MSIPGNLQDTDAEIGNAVAKISPARGLRPSLARQELQDLELDVKQLRDELRRRDDLLDLINKHRAPYRPLHPIALRIIFEILVTPSSFLDPSLREGPHSPWCQTLRVKKGLCLVSRTWGEAAVPLLYGEVTLRRVGQLFALARTLRENPKAYTHVIWSIKLTFYIPEGYQRLVEQTLAYILVVCPHIRYLSFASAFAHWLPSDPIFATNTTDNPLAAALRQAGPRITKFEYFDADLSATKGRYVVPTQLINVFTGIISLTLLLSPPPNSVKDNDRNGVDLHTIPDFPPLTLERLESLTLWRRDAGDYLLAMTHAWKMPRLRSVAFRHMVWNDNVKLGHYLKFIEKFGHGLIYLDFGPHELVRIRPDGDAGKITAILNKCPSLQHLVVDAFYISGGLEALILESMSSHIDIWLHNPINNPLTRQDVEKLQSSPDKRFFRSGVRLLDRGLNHIPDLPRLLPPIPNQPHDDPPLVHRMAGFSVVEAKWCIFQQRADWDNIWDGLPETLSETMEPYRGPPSNQDDPWSETDSEKLQNETDSDVCSHHSDCRYRLPLTGSDSDSSSYFDSDEEPEDDGNQSRYLGDNAPEIPLQELGSLVQLTEGDVLEIFTMQVESSRIPRRDSY